MTGHKKKQMMHIGNILGNSLKSFRKGPDADMTRIWDLWDSAVGETIARNARPSAFKGSLLIIEVSSSSWLHHLSFLKCDIMTKLNSALENNLVKEITFKIGNV